MIEQWSLYLKYKVKAHLLAGPQKRPEGGIEPLRLSSATGLKPALRTTEGRRGIERGVQVMGQKVNLLYTSCLWRLLDRFSVHFAKRDEEK